MGGEADLGATRSFFAERAAGWEGRFPDDGPRFDEAVEALDLQPGQVVLDAGCGTARGAPRAHQLVGPTGLVVALDATPEMLAEARRLGRHRAAALVEGDVHRLPLRAGCVDAVLAAGLLPHLGNPVPALLELHRVTRRDALLAVFHPISRAALAARHGHRASDSVLAPRRLGRVLAQGGWRTLAVHDDDHRYLAVAERRLRPGTTTGAP